MNYYIIILVGIAIFAGVQIAFVYLNHAHTVEMTGKLADRRSPVGLRGTDAGLTHLALLNETLHNLQKELLQVKSSQSAYDSSLQSVRAEHPQYIDSHLLNTHRKKLDASHNAHIAKRDQTHKEHTFLGLDKIEQHIHGDEEGEEPNLPHHEKLSLDADHFGEKEKEKEKEAQQRGYESTAHKTTAIAPTKSISVVIPSKETPSAGKGKKAVLFTMDSIQSYVDNSRKGGAAGEILIRTSLEQAFNLLGVQLTTIHSDNEFEKVKGQEYDYILVDPWTWAGPGWVPKRPIRGLNDRIYIMDFFGSEKLKIGPNQKRGAGHGDASKNFNIPPNRFLTAFGSPWNTFLGYMIDDSSHGRALESIPKKVQGVVWGKDPKHFEKKIGMLQSLLDDIPSLTLVSTSTKPLFQHSRMVWKGHLSSDAWLALLAESKVLIGLGDPLLGPSAIDAIRLGCMYMNPTYTPQNSKKGYNSQHPYAAANMAHAVCSYKEADAPSLTHCVKQALSSPPLERKIPQDFTKEAYLSRVKQVFKL